jgi:hypothetical protein
MEKKYFLITVRSSYDGKANTYIESGDSTYHAFVVKCNKNDDKNGYIYRLTDTIIFAQESKQSDYALFCSNQ